MPAPARHLNLLRERLDRGDVVEFKTGAKVKIERRIVVETPLCAVQVYTEKEIGRAYDLANRPIGPFPMELRPEDDERWGAEAPF